LGIRDDGRPRVASARSPGGVKQNDPQDVQAAAESLG
jgi:hypothetical protein